MNAYQQKLIEILQHTNVPNWTIKPAGDYVLIRVPDNHSINDLANNLETVLAEISLDINLPKERLKSIIKNSREEIDYVLNPTESDLTKGKR